MKSVTFATKVKAAINTEPTTTCNKRKINAINNYQSVKIKHWRKNNIHCSLRSLCSQQTSEVTQGLSQGENLAERAALVTAGAH